MQARAYRQAQRAEVSRTKLSETQRTRRDAAVARKREAAVSDKLDVGCMVGKGGAWADLCWWRNPRDWLPELTEVQQATGARMMRWGSIPKSVDDLLIFVGMERDARRLFCNRTGAAIRKAATDATWTARKRGPKQEAQATPAASSSARIGAQGGPGLVGRPQ